MLKTPAKRQQEARDQKVYAAYQQLIQKGAMKSAAEQTVMKRFGIKGRSTVFLINKRVSTRLTHGKSI